jgi:hypothetical protein
MNRYLTFLAVIFLSDCICYSQGSDVTLDTIDNYNGWGWKALVVDNGYIQLLILPEIGGRVLHYGFENDTYMAVNSSEMNHAYNPVSNQTGPWSSWGYGGYKVWPAPQSFWNWPPPPYLDWGNYTFSIEHSSADSVIIYMKSSVESYKTPGLQQARRFRVYKNSTRVVVEQILKNVSSTRTEWSIWEVTQAIIDHDGTGDYQNISTYFPSNEASIKTLMSPKIQTTEVEENVRKFNYAGSNQKIGTLLNEGWACFVDETDEQTYAKIFDIYPATGQYPDQNSNFQLYVGGAYIEIEVLGPLTDIAQGDSIAYIENWYAAKIRGDIYTANHAGAVRSRLSYTKTTLTLEGEYGIFNSGSLRIKYFNSADQEVGSSEPVNVNATDKYTLTVVASLPEGTALIKLLAYDAADNYIGPLDTFSMSDATPVKSILDESGFHIYPTLLDKGDPLNIEFRGDLNNDRIINIYSLSDGRLVGKYFLDNTITQYKINPDGLESGIYVIMVTSGSMNFRDKFIIN